MSEPITGAILRATDELRRRGLEPARIYLSDEVRTLLEFECGRERRRDEDPRVVRTLFGLPLTDTLADQPDRVVASDGTAVLIDP